MLSSIHPLGERSRNMRWSVTAIAYVVGSMLGGTVTGLAAGTVGSVFLGSLSTTAVAGAIVVIAAVGLLYELRVGGMRLPTNQRQVNEDWLTTYRGWVYGLGFGFQLGLGLVTIVTSASVYATFLLAALSASPATGALIGAAFGVVRSLPIFTVARVHDADRLRSLHRSMQQRAPLAHTAAVASLALVGVVAIGAAAWQ